MQKRLNGTRKLISPLFPWCFFPIQIPEQLFIDMKDNQVSGIATAQWQKSFHPFYVQKVSSINEQMMAATIWTLIIFISRKYSLQFVLARNDGPPLS